MLWLRSSTGRQFRTEIRMGNLPSFPRKRPMVPNKGLVNLGSEQSFAAHGMNDRVADEADFPGKFCGVCFTEKTIGLTCAQFGSRSRTE